MKTRGFPYISIVLLSTTILTCTWFRYQAIPPIKLPSSPQQSLRGHDVIAYVALPAKWETSRHSKLRQGSKDLGSGNSATGRNYAARTPERSSMSGLFSQQ